MTHVYYDPIVVTLVDGAPALIRWRGVTYRVLERNEPWRLIDRWWEPSESAEQAAQASREGAQGGGQGRSDRTYYRLRCAATHDDLTCDIYFEAIGGMWILERVYD